MAAADAQSIALDASEADRLFAALLKYDHLALAVSGGSDSVALMMLACKWRQRHGDAPLLSVLTVDHQLRAAAAGEAAQVSRWAAKLGLPHQTLQWNGEKPQSGLQDAARQVRYRLMTNWCVSHGAQAIVTGHTLDDQAETFLMRLGRGSGLDGLSAMALTSDDPWPLLRPLLRVSRRCLRACLTQAAHEWIDDPTNEDSRFERIRVRKAMDVLQDCGIEAEAIALSAERLGRARQAFEAQTENLHVQAVGVCEDGKILIDLNRYSNAPLELRIRLLQQVIGDEGGQAFSRMSAIERLDDWLVTGSGRARTLGNCKISRRKHSIVVMREPGRSKHHAKHQ